MNPRHLLSSGANEMSGFGIFGSLANALGPFVGGADVAGFILGGVLCVCLWIIVEWAIGNPRNPDPSVFSGAFSLGIIISWGVGWFPPAALIFVAIMIAFIVLDPLSRGKARSQ